MSLINQVLQDLDQRNALSAPDGPLPPQQVRAIPAPPPDREWFWGVVALLIAVALCWVGWVAYQLQPQSVATELAFKAGEELRQRAKQADTAVAEAPAAPAPLSEPAPVAETPKPALTEAPAPAPQPPQPSTVPFEVLRLASSIETPIAQRGPAQNASQIEAPVPTTAKAS